MLYGMEKQINLNGYDFVEKIEMLNEEIRKCRRCGLWKTALHKVVGEGNLNARVMLVAQAPGKIENEKGKMFLGPSGKVLDELFGEAGINRKQIYMTNLIKCMLPKYRKPKKKEIETCSYFLDREIEIVNPEILVPLGFYASQYIFNKYGIKMPEEFYGKLFMWERKIYPLRHPASLLYHNELKEKMVGEYKKLKIFLHECKWFSVCPIHYFYDEGKIDRKWIELYCKGDWESCARYQLEEKGIWHPDNMLPDGSIDEKLR